MNRNAFPVRSPLSPAVLAAAVLWALVLWAAGCDGPAPLKVGFVGGLTGRFSDIGISGRNGVMLAVEEANAGGGVGGRRLELIVRDDRQDTDSARRAVGQLLDLDVAAVLGHMTSAMSMATVGLIDEAQTVMLSPTTTTDALTGRDDHFIRVLEPNLASIRPLVPYAVEDLGLRRVAVIYDLANRDFTESWYEAFRLMFQQRGERSAFGVPFTSGRNLDVAAVVGPALSMDPDGILLVASARDAAILCQHLRRAREGIVVLSSAWAMTRDFLHHGGRAAEGVVFTHWFDQESRRPTYLSLQDRFRKRFGEAPDFAAAFGFEAACVLLEALERDPSPRRLKQTLLARRRHDGLQHTFTIDRFGDASRSHYLIRVENGEFRTFQQ